MSALTRQVVDGWKLKSVNIPSRAELSNLNDTHHHARPAAGVKPSGQFEVGKPVAWTGDADGAAGGVSATEGGPFETTPDLAQVRIVHSIGLMTKSRNAVELKWSGIVDNIKSEEVRAKISNFNPMQSLPACVKITAATIKNSKGADMRNAFHLQVQDAKRKPLHTPHMYVGGAGRRGASETVGYPLHLLTEEGGYVLEEPPQLTDTFRHYWYISNTMLTCCAYKQESSRGNFVQIPKNSDAARLMYYILVTKNGSGAQSSEENITKLSNFDDFQDQNERTCWRFPEFIFNKVNTLLGQKLKDVRDKSFDMSLIRFTLEPFPEFESFADEDMPALITFEIDIHVPLGRDTSVEEAMLMRRTTPHAQDNGDVI